MAVDPNDRTMKIVEKLLSQRELINMPEKGEIVVNFSNTSIVMTVKVHVA